jgi:aminomethyltransferase
MLARGANSVAASPKYEQDRGGGSVGDCGAVKLGNEPCGVPPGARKLSAMSDLKRTPLRDFHAAHGARLVDFAGWEMPVQYRSILEEHRSVRRAAGLFDVSHMGEVDIAGREAARFLNHLVTNDVSRLHPGRVLYSPMCYPNGGVVDDLLVHMRAEGDYFLCLNAGNVEKDLAWIREQAAAFAVTVTDRSAETALLAVQGPKAAAIVQSLTGPRISER